MRQDVWSKRTWQASEKELEQRKTLSEASKPTVNTPEQAKELERQALEKNPVTKLSPEQAQAINEQSKPVVHTPAEAKELEQKVLAENPITKNTPEQAAELEKQLLEYADSGKGRNESDYIEVPKADDKAQNYRPVELNMNEMVTTQRDSEIKAYKATNTHNDIYVSENANVKRKELHQIDMNISESLNKMNVSENRDVPNVLVVSRKDMANNSVAAYRAIENQLLVCEDVAVYKPSEMPKVMEQLACGDNDLSSYVHELYHWLDAEEFKSKYGPITEENYSVYENYINNKAKNMLDKLSAKGYNILVSDYAIKNIQLQRYYEILTEFKTYNLLGGK